MTRLPSFYVLGAQKAATTSLDAWLRAQPSLRLPDLKETHYFSNDERYAKGPSWYLGRFPSADGALRGEVDPDYLSDPRVPERMAALHAGATPRLVAVLREPVGRAFSQWRMSRRRGIERRPFAAALRASWHGAECDDDHDYYGRGRYAAHLARFEAALPDAPRHVLLFEDLVAEGTRERAFAELCAFLGVARDALVAPDFDRAENPAGEARSAVLNRILFGPGRLKRLLRPFVPSQDLRLRIGVLLERANTKAARTRSASKPEVPREVAEAMREDVRDLESVLGRDLSAWRAILDEHEERAVAPG